MECKYVTRPKSSIGTMPLFGISKIGNLFCFGIICLTKSSLPNTLNFVNGSQVVLLLMGLGTYQLQKHLVPAYSKKKGLR